MNSPPLVVSADVAQRMPRAISRLSLDDVVLDSFWLRAPIILRAVGGLRDSERERPVHPSVEHELDLLDRRWLGKSQGD